MNPTLVRPDMRYWRIDPDPRLRPGIVCYFVALPALEARAAPYREELLLPDGYSEIVFSLTSQFERSPLGEPQKRSTISASYVVGGRSHSVLTRNLGDLTIIGVKLESSALRKLIGMPLSAFRDTTVSLADLEQQPLLDLEDALADARSIERITALLNRFFLARMSVFEPGDRLVTESLRQIRARQGALPIVEWTIQCGVDIRHFERRFCAWTGMTPKRYARIVRFKYGYHRLLLGEARRGAAGLHLEHYYDQSHFCRDFKYFIGVTPTSWRTRAMAQGIDISNHLMEGEFRSG